MASPLFSFSVVLREPRPPSVNAMYSTGRGGARFLTKEGKAFKDALKSAVSRQLSSLNWKEAVDEVYLRKGWVHLDISVYIERLYNGSWSPGSRTKPTPSSPKGNLRSPYQRVDAGSYDKIIQDAVVLGTGIDDSAHLNYTVSKVEDPSDPRIEVTYHIYRCRGDGGH